MKLAWLVLGYAGIAAVGGYGQDAAAVQKANNALAARDWVQAVKLLTPLAETNPKDAHVLYDLGSAQDALDQISPAETSYRAAIGDDGTYLPPRVGLGLMLARNGRPDEARTELGKAASMNTGQEDDQPLRARALRALARLDEKEHPAEARVELLAALGISEETPEDTLLAAELAEAAGNGQGAAEAAYRRVLLKQPNEPEATASLGHLLASEKKYQDAEKLLTDGLAAHTGDEAMTVQLASVYAAQGKTAQAISLVETLHAKEPGQAAVSRLLAELYVDAHEYGKVEPLLAVLCDASPRDGELADLRGQSLLHLQHPREAETVLTRVVGERADFRNTEEWGEAARDLAIAAQENNEPEVVLQILSERAKVLPPSAPMKFLSAISEDKLHHRQLAVQAYKEFLAASNGALPDEEFEARHRLVTLEHTK